MDDSYFQLVIHPKCPHCKVDQPALVTMFCGIEEMNDLLLCNECQKPFIIKKTCKTEFTIHKISAIPEND
jgi:hypothetical protein